MNPPRLPPPWCRVRDADELERERRHLEEMQRRERHAIEFGINCRPKVRPADRETVVND